MPVESSASQPIVSIVGEMVALGPQRRDLATLTYRWLNDFAVLAPLGVTPRPLTADAAVRLFEESEAAARDVWFTVYERATMRPLGIAGLRDVDHTQCTAEFVIFLGERECWGKGYGTETARLILDYGFTALGLRNIMLKVYDFNVRGIRAYTRAASCEVGRRREPFLVRQHHHAVVLMACLAAEFRSPVLRRTLKGTASPPGDA